MENKILKTLDFDQSNPTVTTFLRQDMANLFVGYSVFGNVIYVKKIESKID